jgi:hypothetical protein
MSLFGKSPYQHPYPRNGNKGISTNLIQLLINHSLIRSPPLAAF